jgi:hypothetical protein
MNDDERLEKLVKELEMPRRELVLGCVELMLKRILDKCAEISLRQVQDKEPSNDDFLWLWSEVRGLQDITRKGEQR